MSPDTIAVIVSAFAAIVSSVVALIAIGRERKAAIKESTTLIFQEWWSEELRALRRYFFLEFVPFYRVKMIGRGLKEISDIVPEDTGRIERLCSFFDRIGCLGAAGLIDMSYISEPMQHTMRLTWIAVEPLIMKEREFKPDGRFDPVYQYGFEWLFRRSNLPNRHQAHLLQRRFVRPSIFTRREIRAIKSSLDAVEDGFRKRLAGALRQEEARSTKRPKAKQQPNTGSRRQRLRL